MVECMIPQRRYPIIKERQEYLSKYGISFIRFTNVDVLTNIRGVLFKIEASLKELDKR
jgi:very-short-patch-repair endonuclease